MCRVLEVSRSGFYAAQKRPLSDRSTEDITLRLRMTELHHAHRGAPGIIKMWKLLQAEKIKCGRNKVALLRRAAGLETLRTKRFKNMSKPKKEVPPAPDLIERKFKTAKLNKVWVGDMTYLTTRTGSMWLAVYIDLCSHRVVGWAFASTATSELGIRALQNAIDVQQPPPSLICHTDQGSPYSSNLYRQKLADNQIRPSMSRKGNCHDNAVAESFFSSLKNELTHHFTYEHVDSAQSAISDYIEVYYNRERLHQSLDYRTPAQVEASTGAP